MDKLLIFLLILTSALVSCKQGRKAKDDLAETGRTKRTEALLHNLDSISQKGFLVGQQDATLYGVGWEGDSARSDIKSICSEFPAVVGFEIGGIENGSERNIFGTTFATIRNAILAQYDAGGVCLLSWHTENVPSSDETDLMCDFLNTLEEPYGVRVPVILRPCNASSSIEFWKRLRDRMEEKEVTNALLAYTLACEQGSVATAGKSQEGQEEIMHTVDMIGIEMYDNAATVTSDTMLTFSIRLDSALALLTKIGKEYGCPVAIYATGQESITNISWFTQELLPVLDRHTLSFIVFDRNDNKIPGHFFVPFPGHPAVSDFTSFVNSPKTLFLRETNGMYLKR